MARKWHFAVPGVILALAMTMAASAQPLRTAKVGDRIGALVTGLGKINAGPIRSCAEGAPALNYVDYVVPGRPADDDNASFVGLTSGDRIVILVAFDEDDLSTPVAVYADIEGKGLITNAWSVDQAPAPCAVVQQLQSQR
jgi:hypothetical protein